MSNIAIAPSILSADFCNLDRDLKAIANADLVHVDVMDHHFVPNLTLGEPIVGRICQVTDLPVDVHLMIEDPDRWAPEYAKLGAASVSFHMGATHAPVRLARQLREMGCKACFAVRPAEPVEPIFDILDEFDMVLIMTVEPGFGGPRSTFIYHYFASVPFIIIASVLMLNWIRSKSDAAFKAGAPSLNRNPPFIHNRKKRI